MIFNSSTLYELAVLKKHIFPLLTAVQPEDECYDEVRNIVKILNYIQEADVDDEEDGMLAICLQHEVDHLEGKLFIDRISRLKRMMYENKLKKGTRQSQVK